MKLKKWLSLLLGLLLLVVPLAACSSGKNPETPSGSKTDTGETEAPTDPVETADPNTVPDLPSDLDFKGKTIRILTRQNQNRYQEWGSNGVLDDKADDIDEQVYYRNVEIQKKLNVEFDITHATVHDNDLNAWLLSAALLNDSFDIISNKAYQSVSSELLGYYMNLYDVENLNLNKSYWNQTFISAGTVNDHLYTVVGDMNISVYMTMFCMFFNINKCEAQGEGWSMDEIFDVALQGDWTWEKFASYVKDAEVDLGAEKPVYAFYSHTYSQAYDGLLQSFELNLVSTDPDDGTHTLVAGTRYEKLQTATKAVYDLYSNANVKLDTSGYGNGEYNLFDAGEALFSIECVNDAQNRKNANLTDEYGLLPLPKYEADGTANYYTGLQDSHNVISVVKGRSNYAAIGAVLELLSAYSYEGIRPYYVNTLAKQKYLDNLKSQKVMDLILDGARWDFAAIYAAYLPNRDGNAPHMALWRGGCQHGNTAYRYEQHKDTWNKLLKQFDADEHFARKSAS